MANKYFELLNEKPGIDSKRIDRIACRSHPNQALEIRERPTRNRKNAKHVRDGDSGEAEHSFQRETERHSGMIPNTIGA